MLVFWDISQCKTFYYAWLLTPEIVRYLNLNTEKACWKACWMFTKLVYHSKHDNITASRQYRSNHTFFINWNLPLIRLQDANTISFLHLIKSHITYCYHDHISQRRDFLFCAIIHSSICALFKLKYWKSMTPSTPLFFSMSKSMVYVYEIPISFE